MSKSIVITGGSRGIGAATARLAGQRGWSVVINFVGNQRAADDTVRAVAAAGGKAIAVQGDVAAEADVVRLFDAAEKAFGPIDGLVNNAGILGPSASLVNLSSAAAKLGAPKIYVDYAATKGGIESLTIGLSKEVGDEGIRVNAIRPGLIETDIHASGGEPDRAQRLGVTAPLGRAGTADEVGEAIVWLLSDAASYVSGAIIDVTGGR